MEIENQGESPRLYRNRGSGIFSDVTEPDGLDRLLPDDGLELRRLGQ